MIKKQTCQLCGDTISGTIHEVEIQDVKLFKNGEIKITKKKMKVDLGCAMYLTYPQGELA